MKKLLVLMVLAFSVLVSGAQAQRAFGIGVNTTFNAFGLEGIYEEGNRSEFTRFGVWVNVPGLGTPANSFVGVGGNIVIAEYAGDLLGIGLELGRGDLIAPYGGVYGNIALGGQSIFFMGVGVLLGLEVNPIPQVFGVFAELGLGFGIPALVDAYGMVGAKIYMP